MPDIASKRLSKLDCIAHAEECRKLARAALGGEHRLMLTHIAETWDRIALDIEARAKRQFPRLV